MQKAVQVAGVSALAMAMFFSSVGDSLARQCRIKGKEASDLVLMSIGTDLRFSGNCGVGRSKIVGTVTIKNVGESAVDIVLEARDKNGPFESYVDFCCRLDSQKVNKRVLEGLIKVGAFDSMGTSRASLFEVLDPAMEHASTIQRNKREGQTSLFDLAPEDASTEEPKNFGFVIPPKPEWSQN